MRFTDLVAKAALAVGSLVPLFWVPFYLWSGLRKQLGLFYYPLILSLWFILVYYLLTTDFHAYLGNLSFPSLVRIFGLILISGGISLGLVSFFYLREQIAGRHHFQPGSGHLVTQGPFSWVRHPTYLGHTLFFLGAFLFSGYLTVALLVVVDFFLIRRVIIPQEEKELLNLYGEAYKKYQEKTPCFFPRIWKR